MDGLTDFAFWRPSTAQFFVWYRNTSASWYSTWSHANTVAVVRDYDGDWMADMATYDSANGNWSIFLSSTGATSNLAWGSGSQQPLQNFNASGGY